MKYILMMSFRKEYFDRFSKLSKEELQAHMAHMVSLNKELKGSGAFVAAEGLAWPDQAKMVRAGANGQPITDGVFPESKEFRAGFWIVDVESPEQAYAIAARASLAPGPAGPPGTMLIEVRPVLSGPPKDFQ
jgi:hypothetical protein